MKGVRWMRASATPRANRDGVLLWEGACIDITEDIAAERQRILERAARQRQVLLLEDEPLQARLVARSLEANGVRCEWFTDGVRLVARSRALRALGRDLVCLLDIGLRDGRGGLDILGELCEAVPEARLVLVSGYSEEWAVREERLSPLGVGFLAKPYSVEDLCRIVLEPGQRA
jgi:ActR/RegA family two-component response regulator